MGEWEGEERDTGHQPEAETLVMHNNNIVSYVTHSHATSAHKERENKIALQLQPLLTASLTPMWPNRGTARINRQTVPYSISKCQLVLSLVALILCKNMAAAEAATAAQK